MLIIKESFNIVIVKESLDEGFASNMIVGGAIVLNTLFSPNSLYAKNITDFLDKHEDQIEQVTSNNTTISVLSRDNNRKDIYEIIILEGCKILNLDNVHIFIADSKYNKDLVNTHDTYKAAVVKISETEYVININQEVGRFGFRELTHIILHELMHIKQIKEKRMHIKRYTVWFDGVTYTAKDSYSKRSYEKEAEEFAKNHRQYIIEKIKLRNK